MYYKNQVHRNKRHSITNGLRPVEVKQEVKEKPTYFYCSRATIVATSDNRMKAYCPR